MMPEATLIKQVEDLLEKKFELDAKAASKPQA